MADDRVPRTLRAQEIGWVRRKGSYSSWVRHISLITKDTFNVKQDSEAILKNLPNLITQLNMDIWGKKDDEADEDDEGKSYVLGDFVLDDGVLYPANDPAVHDKNLEVLDLDNLLYHISMQLLGRKPPEGTVDDLKKQIKNIKDRDYQAVADLAPLWV
jgi:hypothetical protein